MLQYPPRVKAVVDIVIYLIVIAWCVILCYFSIPYVIQTIQTGGTGHFLASRAALAHPYDDPNRGHPAGLGSFWLC